ncbi:sugar phosphate isomerase/epimerase family protein [Rathayibacter sp. VKM Ac-2804]|uniref:sugar phosphate isomerase/epimerase family protein n=1 Tax=Rathayibacter sp. VKM Ac-2804 TaxID=2609257 RepID=UPI001FCA140E|nr:sugar phosphate isomerase/epimerase family protein [Rathayibacter sp. VKM Ac-2804]
MSDLHTTDSPVLGYGTNGFADHTLDDALTVLHAAGYRAVALTLGTPHLDPFADDVRERTLALRARLDELGFRVVIETGARYLLDPFAKHRPTLVDEEAGPRLAFLHRAIEIAALLGADAVSLWSGVLPDGVDRARGWRLLVERMRGVVAEAERYGVRLGFEPEPGMLVETVADALLLRRELGDPEAFGLTVDLGHCVVVEPDGVVGALRSAAGLLVNVQVDDMLPERHEHLELGTGVLDLATAFATLEEIGYRGIAAVELPRHSHDAPRLAVASLAAMRAAMRAAIRTRGTGAESPQHPWTADACAVLREQPRRIERCFPAAGREAGRAPLRPDADPQGLVHGTQDDAARSALLAAAASALDDEDLAALLLRLYRGGDDAERRGVLVGARADRRRPCGGAGRRGRARAGRGRPARQRHPPGRRGDGPLHRGASRRPRLAARRAQARLLRHPARGRLRSRAAERPRARRDGRPLRRRAPRRRPRRPGRSGGAPAELRLRRPDDTTPVLHRTPDPSRERRDDAHLRPAHPHDLPHHRRLPGDARRRGPRRGRAVVLARPAAH